MLVKISHSSTIRLSIFALLTALWFLFNPTFAQTAQAEIIHVDADSTSPSPDGRTWPNAFPNLQDALAKAETIGGFDNEIWVAKGVYYPDEGDGQTDNGRDSTFQLLDDVKIYGGFSGTETELDERDWTKNVTVLSGDLGKDDTTNIDGVVTTTSDINGQNAFNVVTGIDVGAFAELNGFTVTAGQAERNIEEETFRVGGGMRNERASPIIANTTFHANLANRGGGMSNEDNSNPALTNVIFLANVANVQNATGSGDGGGIRNIDSSPTLTNVTFNANRSANTGGGMTNSNSFPTLHNVVFNANQAKSGGGIRNIDSSPTLINVTISANSASANGGGMQNFRSNPALTNVIIWGNQAAAGNSIVNDNSNPVINFSLIEGFAPSDLVGDDNLDGTRLDNDPRFVRNGILTTDPPFPGDLRLGPGSPAIDVGSNEAPEQAGISTDIAGNLRIQNETVDLGAYEALPCPSGGIIHVKQGGAGSKDGSSWEDAFEFLQDALVVGESCEIWVAQGVYYPDEGGGQRNNVRSSTFQLLNDVKIYGGFNGTETEREARDWKRNITVLSGDIDENDTDDANGIVTNTENITGNNAYHVVNGSGTQSSTLLDGFTITAGLANGAFVPPCGSSCGGGMYNHGSSPTLTNIVFKANRAQFGGGMTNQSNSNPTLTGVTFNANLGVQAAGGMANLQNSSPILTNVLFVANSSRRKGGGMANLQNSNPVLTNVSFNANSAVDGGGMAISESSPTLTNVTFNANVASSGSGIDNSSGSNPALTNVIIWGNHADDGKSIFNDSTSIPTINFSLVEGISAVALDGLGNLDGTDPNNDPRFAQSGDASTTPPTPGVLRLRHGSPAIDTGFENATELTNIDTDLAGKPRIQIETVDMGAYEALACPEGGVFHVKEDGAGTKDGTSWENAFSFLQDALSVGESCEIWVAKGIYFPDEGDVQADNDRKSTFHLLDDVAIYGGFDGTETEREQRDGVNNVTVLSGDIDGNDQVDANKIVTTTTHISGTNAYHVVTGSGITTTATIDGFTITAGQANGRFRFPCGTACGGGLFNENSKATISNLIFRANTARANGGGMANVAASSPIITDVTLRANTTSDGDGGGMANRNSSPLLTNITFDANATNNGNGGGLFNLDDVPILTNVTFLANSASKNGGGIYNDNSDPVLINVAFNANSARFTGGGISNDQSDPTLINVTLSANSASSGGGIENFDGSDPTLTNALIWGNNATNGKSIATDSADKPLVNSSLIEGFATGDLNGSDNLDGTNPVNDPLFLQNGDPITEPPKSRDLRLQADSPAIDEGDTISFTNATSITVDLDGNPRVSGSAIDMGAYEFNPPTPNTPPVADGQALTTTVDAPIIITLTGSDEENDPLTVVNVSQPLSGTLSGTLTGTLIVSDTAAVYIPDPGFIGTDSFTFVINDGAVDSEPATITINVTEASSSNTAPIANPQTVNTTVGTTKTITLTGSDADGDNLFFSLVAQPSNGTATIEEATVVYTPTAGFVGLDSFPFKVNDGTVDSEPAAITINVTEASSSNTAPIANPQTVNTTVGTTKTITLTGSDADSDDLFFSLVAQPPNGTASIEEATVVYTPTAGFVGLDSFTFVVRDGTVDSEPATVTINVTETPASNTAPIANPQTVNTTAGTARTIILTGSDDDNDALTFRIVDDPANGTVPPVAFSTVTYTPNPNFAGEDSFTFVSNDGTVDSEPATVTINVAATLPSNTAPVANPQTVNAGQDEAISIALTGSDADEDLLFFRLASQPTNGTATLTDGVATYTPSSGFIGQDSFTFLVNDGTVDSTPATITINVAATPPSNTAPVANPQVVKGEQDEAISITLTGSDADSDALIFRIVSPPANGTATLSGDVASYTPAAGFTGQDSFTFVVRDGTDDSAPATVTIRIESPLGGTTGGGIFLPFVSGQ